MVLFFEKIIIRGTAGFTKFVLDLNAQLPAPFYAHALFVNLLAIDGQKQICYQTGIYLYHHAGPGSESGMTAPASRTYWIYWIPACAGMTKKGENRLSTVSSTFGHKETEYVMALDSEGRKCEVYPWLSDNGSFFKNWLRRLIFFINRRSIFGQRAGMVSNRYAEQKR